MPDETITVPASFVNLLREKVVALLTNRAIDIADSGREHPEGIDESELESFERYAALLRCVGCVPTVPAEAVQIALSQHRWALITALHHGLDFERWMAKEGDPSYRSGAKQRSAALRKVGRMEKFLIAAGLEDVTHHDVSVEVVLERYGEG